MMKRLAVLAVVAVCTVGCSSKTAEPERASVSYESEVAKSKIVLSEPLAGTINARLGEEPDIAEKGFAMGIDTGKYLHVGATTFQVAGNELVLADDWGVKTWKVQGIEATLDALVQETPNQRIDSDKK